MGKSKSFLKKTCMFTNVALKKAQALIEMSQVNLKISNFKSKIERKCAVIGALFISKKNGGSKKLTVEQCEEKIEKLCQDVEKLRKKLKKSRNEAKEIKQHLNNCSFCDDCCSEGDECDDDLSSEEESNLSEEDYDYDDFSKFEDD